MMEPSNLGHRHLQQEQLLGSSSSSSLAASSPRVAAGSSHAWHPSLILNTDLITPTVSEEVLSTSRDLAEQSSDGLVVQLPPLTTTMVQDLCSRSTPHWEYPSSRIKEEQSHSFMKLMSSSVEDYNLHEQILLNVPAEKLLLQTLLASGYQPDVLRLPVSAGGCPGRNWAGLSGDGRGGNYSLVLPTVTISGASPPLPPSPVQSPGFHRLLGSAGLINGELDATSSDNPSYLFKHERAFGLGSVQDRATHEPSMNQHKMSRVSVAEAKRASSSSSCDTEGSQQPNRSACKKPRVECRSSIASCKVRKEKLGDRIAALQQLVAPFGKTDTASVLMEAIGYIKFLQDQVETLSVPYLRSSGSNRASQGVPSKEVEVPKLDLRSRGLCLVPLSCTSYVTNENIVIWPPPNFMGGT